MTKTCKKWKTTTPGSLVQGQASKVLGGWADQLNLATEIDQIIGALISHFADKIAAPGNKGFLGLSSPGGYATNSTTNYANVIATADNLNNPENAGLGAANAAANVDIDELFPTTGVDASGNVASGKAVRTSGTAGDATLANDGDPSTAGETDAEQDPWMEIDLGSATEIAAVQVWSPEGEDAQTALGSFRVVISSTPNTREWVSPLVRTFASSPNPITVSIERTGRYVRIERTGNAHQCEDIETYYATCYYPLRVGEIEVVEIPKQADRAGNATSGEVTLGPAQGSTAISQGAPLHITLPISATQTLNIKNLSVELYSGTTQVWWSTVLGNGSTISLSQNGVARNFTPGATSGIPFANVLAGGSYDTALIFKGSTSPSQPKGAYRIVVTARDELSEVIDSATINFVVQ